MFKNNNAEILAVKGGECQVKNNFYFPIIEYDRIKSYNTKDV